VEENGGKCILFQLRLPSYCKPERFPVQRCLLSKGHCREMDICLKVHKRVSFLGFDFEICTFS
jgi:hypothetical protein